MSTLDCQHRIVRRVCIAAGFVIIAVNLGVPMGFHAKDSGGGRGRGIRAALGIGLCLTFVFCMLSLHSPAFLGSIEGKLLDYRFELRGAQKPSGSVVIAAIDEKSLRTLGRWPWGRDKLAVIVNNLSRAGAKVIMLDTILSEKSGEDGLLEASLLRAGDVVLPVTFHFADRLRPSGGEKLLEQNSYYTVSHPGELKPYPPPVAAGVLSPVPGLMSEASALGFINVLPDDDGSLRWDMTAIGYGGYLYPSADIQVAAQYLGIPSEKIDLDWPRGVRLGNRLIPTDRYGRTLIDYYGPERSFPYISAADIYENRFLPGAVRGKIVLVGATAVGLNDVVITPFSPVMPGIEKHATIISSILQGRFLRKASKTAGVIIVLITGLMFTVMVSRLRAAGALAALAGFMAAGGAGGYLAFLRGHLWGNLLYPSANVLAIFILVSVYKFAVEERYARRIRAMFSSYVTERVVSELVKNPAMAKLGGGRAEVTVLFSDVRGFTNFSEKHAPEEVVSILNEYLGAMTETIFRWEGTLDKFIGDAILAFWGAPLKQENHAELAIRCALDMERKVEELRGKWVAEGKTPLDMGIGINTGEVLVGNIGAQGKKMDYTVIGDSVNLGSRIEALTRKYNVRILITGFTLQKIKDLLVQGKIGHVEAVGIESVIVKGKETPVRIYEIRNIAPGSASRIINPDTDRIVRFDSK